MKLDIQVGYAGNPSQGPLDLILHLVKEHEVDPTDVTIEITESTAMADPERTQRVLGELHTLGFKLAIDDFGTGYSSLARLKHMPVERPVAEVAR